MARNRGIVANGALICKPFWEGAGTNGISRASTNAEGAIVLVVPRASHATAQRRGGQYLM